MRIFVRAKPGSKKTGVEKIDETHYTVAVKEPAKENKANFAVLETLSSHFGIPLSRIRLVSGRASKEKVIEIL